MGTIITSTGNSFPVSPLGGGGKISIFDETTLISNAVTSIRFEGADVQAVQDVTNPNGVIIRVPVSLTASHFNSNDGIASAIVPNISTVNRNIANPNGHYDIADWIVPTSKPSTQSTSISYSPASFFSILDNTSTTFKATMLSADKLSEIASHTITLTGNTDVTLNNIRVVVSGFTSDDTKYKANITVYFTLSNLLPNSGRFSFKLEHTNGAEGTFTKTQNDIFFDRNVNAPVISNPTFSVNSEVTKYISGVNYYTKNTTFNVGIGNANYLNDSSYPNNQISIFGTEIGTSQIDLQGSSLIAWNTDWDNINASYTKNDWNLTTDNIYRKDNLKIQARWIDWTNGSLQDSLTQSLLIDTYLNNRTRVKEDFINETFRLKHDNTLWDSSIKLNEYTNNLNALQLENSRLVYPQLIYTTYNPDDVNQPDYTSLTGDRFFKSYFFYTNVSKSNGIFGLGDHNITENDLTNDDIRIEISLNNNDWFNCNLSFFGGVLTDGSGCRIDSGTYNLSSNRIRFTLSTFFTSDTTGSSLGGYWGIYFRVTYKDTVRGRELYLGSLELLDW